MRFVSILLNAALSSLVLAAPAPARGSAEDISASVKNANIAVLRFDNGVNNLQTPDSTSVQPVLRAGTMAVSVIQQASSEVSGEGRTGIQGAPVAQQAITDFSLAMNKAADDLVAKQAIIKASGQDGIFLDVYTSQANAGLELMQGVMSAMPPRERSNAAQALAAIPAGIDKVQAAFGTPSGGIPADQAVPPPSAPPPSAPPPSAQPPSAQPPSAQPPSVPPPSAPAAPASASAAPQPQGQQTTNEGQNQNQEQQTQNTNPSNISPSNNNDNNSNNSNNNGQSQNNDNGQSQNNGNGQSQNNQNQSETQGPSNNNDNNSNNNNNGQSQNNDNGQSQNNQNQSETQGTQSTNNSSM